MCATIIATPRNSYVADFFSIYILRFKFDQSV